MSITYRHNIMEVGSVPAFARVRGGCTQEKRDVYFLRMIGGNDVLRRDLQEIDDFLGAAMDQHQLHYKRVSVLPADLPEADREYYLRSYEQWIAAGGCVMRIRTEKDNAVFGKVLGDALKAAEQAYDRLKPGNTESMKRNFIIKLIRWTDFVMAGSPVKWTERTCIKIVADNVVKVQEYLFYYMLTLVGADVMLLQTRQDIQLPEWLAAYSKERVLGAYVSWDLPAYVHTPAAPKAESTFESGRGQENSNAQGGQDTIRVRIPERARRKPAMQPGRPMVSAPPGPSTAAAPQGRAANKRVPERREKNFEELARLASSVVMITIHDERGESVGSGSGIMIGENGYILTNFHVVSGGRFYSVQIEDDATVYRTDELIKYHPDEDLAIIRITKKLNPLPIYQGHEELVRGQRVVAIGSPLGLFNSVSDGIISGFRTIDSIDMMQFTAPTSPGSSGGAVLNMYGEVIGISTAGVDRGQNINLAVLYKTIGQFIKGFC